MLQRRSKSRSSERWITSNLGHRHRKAPGIFRGLFLAFCHPPTVAGIFMPFPCGGSGGVLSGLFFCGILFHPGVLSACVGLLVPLLHRCIIIPLLQRRYKPYTGRFSGVASCTTSGILFRPGQRGGAVGHRPGRSGVAAQVGRPANLGRVWKRERAG